VTTLKATGSLMMTLPSPTLSMMLQGTVLSLAKVLIVLEMVELIKIISSIDGSPLVVIFQGSYV